LKQVLRVRQGDPERERLRIEGIVMVPEHDDCINKPMGQTVPGIAYLWSLQS